MEQFNFSNQENIEEAPEAILLKDFMELATDTKQAVLTKPEGDINFLLDLREKSKDTEQENIISDDLDVCDDEGILAPEKLSNAFLYKYALSKAFSAPINSLGFHFTQRSTLEQLSSYVESLQHDFNNEIDPSTVDEDEMRKTIARQYNLSEDASWDEIVKARDAATPE